MAKPSVERNYTKQSWGGDRPIGLMGWNCDDRRRGGATMNRAAAIVGRINPADGV